MATISQTTYSSAFSWKIYEFLLRFHWFFVPEFSNNNIQALVQIMAWHGPGDKPLSEPMMVSLLMHICVTWPQWVECGHILKSWKTPHATPSRMRVFIRCLEKSDCGVSMWTQCIWNSYTIRTTSLYRWVNARNALTHWYHTCQGYWGYFWESHWKSMWLLEISRVT